MTTPPAIPDLAQVLAPPPPPERIHAITPAYTGVAGAAAYMQLGRNTIRRLVTSGALPARRLPSGMIRIRISDLDALGEAV